MDQVTQQNAALVEEAAAAAESMKDQAHNLSASVGQFRLAEAAAAGATTAPRGSAARSSGADAEWDGRTERRGPDRAQQRRAHPGRQSDAWRANHRSPANAAVHSGPVETRAPGGKTGTHDGAADGEWEQF